MKIIMRRDPRIPEFVLVEFSSGKTLRTEDILVVTIALLVASAVAVYAAWLFVDLVFVLLALALLLASVLRKPWVVPEHATPLEELVR